MAPEKSTLDQLKIHRPAAAPRNTNVARTVTIVVLVLALAAAAIWWFKRPQTAVVRTIVVQAKTTDGPRTLLNASGYVTARRQATVSSKVTGKVQAVLIEEGMKVEENQVLARLDASNVESNLRLAEAQLQSSRSSFGETEASLELARRELKRTQQLAEARGVSASDVDRASAQVDTLKARLERQRAEATVAERQISLWKQQLDDTIIRAPFAGVVVSKNAQPGEMISPMSSGGFTRTGICTIVDMASLEVEVDVNESYINRVVAGQPVVVTLDSYPEWRIPAKVIAIVPTADRQKATVRVRVGFETLDPRILPDMGLKVAFQEAAGGSGSNAATTRAIAVPKIAVRRVDNRDVVWLVRGDHVERRAVTVDSSTGDEVVLTAGVNSGDRLVVEGAEKLSDGMRVKDKSG